MSCNSCGKCGGCRKSKSPVQRELDNVLLEVSTLLGEEELGGRRRAVFYRNRLNLAGEDTSLGLPGTVSEPWQRICPNPATEDSGRDFTEDQIGLILKGDLQMRVDRLALSREILATSEFFIPDDPDISYPMPQTDANYDLIGGSVLEGGGGTRQRYRSFWICFLRKRQSV